MDSVRVPDPQYCLPPPPKSKGGREGERGRRREGEGGRGREGEREGRERKGRERKEVEGQT